MGALRDAIIAQKRRELGVSPVHTNRASELGHPCERYLYYRRTAWQEQALPPVELEFIWGLGRAIERLVLEELEQAGVTVIEQQRAYDWPEFEITGHIDAKVMVDGRVYPLEIKGFSPSRWQKIKTVDSLIGSDDHYLRQVLAQLTLYLLLSNSEQGILLIKNKLTGDYKDLIYDLDYDYGESLLQKAQRINEAVRNQTPPERIKYDDAVCMSCGFIHICCPPVDRQELQFDIEDQELQRLLTRWLELRDAAAEWMAIDEQLKDKTKGQRFAVGNFLFDGEWTERTIYDVPDEIKAQYAKRIRYWRRVIKELDIQTR